MQFAEALRIKSGDDLNVFVERDDIYSGGYDKAYILACLYILLYKKLTHI